MRRLVFSLVFLLAGTVLFARPISWERAKTVQKGVKLVKIETKKPRLQKINAMRIDLKTPGLRFAATGRDADYGKPMPDFPSLAIQTKRMRTKDFAAELLRANKDVIVAANAAPWTPWTKPFDHQYGRLPGLNVSDGVVVGDDRRHGAVFLVRKNGVAEIWTELVPETLYPQLQIAVSGFGPVVVKGKNVGAADAPMPRIAYGLSADRRYLYIVTVDGRQEKWSMGATLEELGSLMLDAGASDALNMDGGGSATLLYVDRRRHIPVVVNRHNENGYTRPVASNIAIYLEKR